MNSRRSVDADPPETVEPVPPPGTLAEPGCGPAQGLGLVERGFEVLDQDPAAAQALARAALALTEPPCGPSLRARALHVLGMADCLLGQVAQGASQLQEAAAALHAHGPAAAECRVLCDLGGALTNLTGDLPGGVQALERALALAREHGLTELEAYVLNDIGRAYAVAKHMDQAFASFAAAYERWRALGNEPMMADSLGIWSEGLLLYGNLAEAERIAREGLDVGRRIGNLWTQAFNGYAVADSLLEQGRMDEALPLLRAAVDWAIQGGFPSLGGSSAVVLRWLAGAAGLPAADHEQLAAVIAGMGDVNYAHELRLLWRGLDLFYAGDAAAAYEQVAGVFITDYSREGPQAVTLTLIVPAIALAAGRPAEALAVIDRLLADMAVYGFTSQHGDAYRLRGDALRQLGRDDEARAAYTTALDIATAQGALRSVEPARAALEKLGIRN